MYGPSLRQHMEELQPGSRQGAQPAGTSMTGRRPLRSSSAGRAQTAIGWPRRASPGSVRLPPPSACPPAALSCPATA